jgi:D-lactate dehydrogenase
MQEVLFFSTQGFEQPFYAGQSEINFRFLTASLSPSTMDLVGNHKVICLFTCDRVEESMVKPLYDRGVRLIALRCAGFNNVAVDACKKIGIEVLRVPEYSPHAVAEHTVALILTLNRKIHKAYNRVREGNFSLDGLIGFDLFQKTVGVIGTGKIGSVFTRIMLGFGCKVLAFDMNEDEALKKSGVNYTDLTSLLEQSDIVSLHVPLNPQTKYLIAEKEFSLFKKTALLVNTSRGGLVHTKALIQALKSKAIAGAALDVYEEEDGLFFHDFSSDIIADDVIMRLIGFPNVLITSHQAFLTQEALRAIADTTLRNIKTVRLD